MSGGLAPSRSTVYVGNLPFTLTNNDIHQVFENFGKIVKVTVLSDKYTRQSKGVAFIQYIDRDSAINACKSVNGKQLFERNIKCVIAKDNGRANEFIKKKEYPDKTTCYQCKQSGHLSYFCPNNKLGDREPPVKKEKKERKRKADSFINHNDTKINKVHFKYGDQDDDEEEEEAEKSPVEEGEDPRLSSLSSAVESEAEKYRYEQFCEAGEPSGSFLTSFTSEAVVEKKRLIKKSSYFSDEEEEDDDG